MSQNTNLKSFAAEVLVVLGILVFLGTILSAGVSRITGEPTALATLGVALLGSAFLARKLRPKPRT